jgi:hypothetical protein
MASVHLRFVVPDIEDLTTMRIYEGADPNSSFAQIEAVTPIGTYPDYIDSYTTNMATSVDDYFAIAFVDSKGFVTDLSSPVQGTAQLAISEIVSRVIERNSTLSERVALQEAEAAISYAFPGFDPYDPAFQPTYLEKRGLTNLTLAMSYLGEMAQGTSSQWVAGIVSMKSSDQAIIQRQTSIDRLIKQANKDLGINFSLIAHLENLSVAGIPATITSIDQSRLLVEIR